MKAKPDLPEPIAVARREPTIAKKEPTRRGIEIAKPALVAPGAVSRTESTESQLQIALAPPTAIGPAVQVNLDPSPSSPSLHVLLREEVQTLSAQDKRPVALVDLNETIGQEALATLGVRNALVQRSPAEAVEQVRDGRLAAALFAPYPATEALLGLSLDGVRAMQIQISEPTSR